MKNAGQISMWRLRPVRGTSVIVCDFYDDAGRGAILWSFASPVRLSRENAMLIWRRAAMGKYVRCISGILGRAPGCSAEYEVRP